MIRLIVVVALIVSGCAQVLAQDDSAGLIAECDRLAASDIDPERPASLSGVPVGLIDAKEAVPACEAAAKVAPNDRRISYELGRAYHAAKDYEKARAQYSRADGLGSLLAATNLGVLYQNELGGVVSLATARALYEKAAAGGVTIAMAKLGWMYSNGASVPRDDKRALAWYEKAADLGYAPAMTAIGEIHYFGKGVPKNLPRPGAGSNAARKLAIPKQWSTWATFSSMATAWMSTSARRGVGMRSRLSSVTSAQ